MEDSLRPGLLIRFEAYRVDLQSGELYKNGQKVKLSGQPFEVLAMLVQRPGELVTREELQKKLWPEDTFVDFDHGLNTAINKIREALGDSAENPHFVETLPRRGYRFIADVGAGLVPALEGRPRGAPLRKRWALLLTGMLGVMAVGLSIAWFLTHRPAPSPPELKERRLTANPSENAVNQGVISPDGKYLAYSDATGMHLKLIRTGETIAIPQPEGPAPEPCCWWPYSWFPDGTKFVASAVEAGGVSAWVISVMGGPPRKLRDDADAWSVSPDGTLIAFGRGSGFVHSREIWLMDAQGEEPRRFVSGSEDDSFWQAAWSPDGQRIAYYGFRRTPEKLECAIESRDLKGGQPTVLMSDPRSCDLVGSIWWSPGGRFIYKMLEPLQAMKALSNTNLWEIRVDPRTGQAVNKPRRLTNWSEVILGHISETSDGSRLAIVRASMAADVYVGELEAGGRRLKNTRRLTLNENNDYPGRWMPDGKTLLFTSDRNGTWDIFKQSLDQTEAQPVVTGPDLKCCPVVSPDGSWILYLSSAAAQASPTAASGQVGPAALVRILRVPAHGGAPQLVLEGRGIDGLACAQSPAALCAFSERSPDQKQVVISAFDPVNGRGKELTRINLRPPISYYGWDLSPDGSRLAFIQEDEHEDRIRIIPLGGGQAHEVNVKGWNHIYGPTWAADGKGLMVGAYPTTGTTLLYVDLEGRAVVLWQQRLPYGWPMWAVPSPDTRHLALTRYSNEGNVWLLENF